MAKTRSTPLDFSDPLPTAELTSSEAGAPLTTTASSALTPIDATPVRLRSRPAEADGGSVVLWSVLAAVLWIAGVGAAGVTLHGLDGLLALDPVVAITLALLALAPVGLITVGAVLLRQAARLAAHNRRAEAETQRLLTPALLAASQAGGAVEQVRGEIEAAVQASDAARAALGSLAELLSAETRALGEATVDVARTAQGVTDTVAGERDQLAALGRRLEDQAAAVTEAVGRQARMVSDAAELASTQIGEAEAGLSARTADLAAAAGEATDAARAAGGDLSRQTQRLETAAGDLAEHVRAMETGLSGQRASLADLGQTLSGQQEAFSARAEALRLELAEALGSARIGAEEIGAASAASGEALQALIAGAATRIEEIAETVRDERAQLEAGARDSFGSLSASAEEERARIQSGALAAIEALADAAQAAARSAHDQAEAARSQVEQLSEAAFSAGKQADEAFESRLAAARRMIDESATLVQQAGDRSTERVEAGLNAARASMAELERALDAVDARIADLPDTAQARVEDVRRAVEQGIAELQAAARAAAAQTEGIDAAFQARVRRNYETLSQAVSLMGAVGAPEPQAVAVDIAPEPDLFEAEPEPEPEQAEAPASAPEEDRAEEDEAPVGDETLFEAPPEADVVEPETAEPQPDLDPQSAGEPEPPAPTINLQPKNFTVSIADAGLRPRVRYFDEQEATPAQDEALFEPAAPDSSPEPTEAPAQDAPALDDALFEPEPVSAEGEGFAAVQGAWTWQDLLRPAASDSVDDEALAERLSTALAAMNIDAERLLPRTRVEEIAAPIQAGDRDGARQVVRGLAPAAVRRLARRLQADPILRADATRFRGRYAAMLQDAAHRDRAGYMTATLLASEAGRLWLMFDAVDGV